MHVEFYELPMDTTWIMFFSKCKIVASQEIWRNLPNEYQRICVAVFNESRQELSIELECMPAVDQKGIGCGLEIIPLRNFKNCLLMAYAAKQSGFSFLNRLVAGEKPLIWVSHRWDLNP